MPSLISIKVFLLSLLLSTQAFAQRGVPAHGGIWVHDEANILSAGTIAELEAILKSHRDSTSNQIAVLIVPSLEGEDIDGYANRVFREWKLGQEKKDNGVLFLVSMGEKQMRIEVGFGLEGVLTDAMSSRINRKEVAPYFRQGDYDGGIRAATLAIIQVIKGEYVNDDPVTRKKSKRSPISTILIVIIIIIILSRKNKRGGGGYWSSGGGFMGPMIGGGFGGSSSSWGSGSDFGGGGDSGGGGSSDSW